MPARYVRPYSKGQKNDFRDIVGSRFLSASSAIRSRCISERCQCPQYDDIDFQLHELSGKFRIALWVRIRKAPLHDEILALDIAMLTPQSTVMNSRRLTLSMGLPSPALGPPTVRFTAR
jgi:hypothetical protein